MDFRDMADLLYAAEASHRQTAPLTGAWPDMSVHDAYLIQLENIRRYRAAGRILAGVKAAMTSKAVQQLFGADVPAFGHLFADMIVPEGQPVSERNLNEPRVEGERTFCMKKALAGPGVTIADVYAATAYVVPSLELVDSRIPNAQVRLQDVLADNCSASGLVLGSGMTPVDQVDMQLTGMNLYKNGELVHTGTTAEVCHNPAWVVAFLANTLAEYELELPAGSLVMTGAVTAPVPAAAGDTVTAVFTGMGSVSVRFVP